ncbi:MAG: M56 family metallopeptidase [Gemmatimonadota bacterium]|nr:M56 family metallopeptidase [Gemmatimonadota bacterium]
MIASWLFYSVVLSALFTAGAISLERMSRLWHRSVRFVWLLAIVASATAPVAIAVLAQRAPSAVVFRPTTPRSRVAPTNVGAVRQRSAPSTWRSSLLVLDRPLMAIWPILSMLVLGVFVRAALVVRRERRRWRTANLDGVPVLVAPEVGPAVVGFTNTRVVVPEWALGIEPALRGLMLRHELEHIRARDPLALLTGAAALVLMPWNIALWWQVRRLRLAIELDCDRRVLRVASSAREYASLLLAVGQRATPIGSAVWAPALSESPSSLERRIVAMTSSSSTHRTAQAAVLAAAVVAIVAVACETPHPDPVAPQQGRTSGTVSQMSYSPTQRRGDPALEARIRTMILQHFPEVAKGDTSHRPMMFVMNSASTVIATARGAAVAGAMYKTMLRQTPNGDHNVIAENKAAPAERRAFERPRENAGQVLLQRTPGPAGSGEPTPFSNLDPTTIDNVEVLKFPAGKMGPDAVAVILITLKPGALLPGM